jgi:hypothetical protein
LLVPREFRRKANVCSIKHQTSHVALSTESLGVEPEGVSMQMPDKPRHIAAERDPEQTEHVVLSLLLDPDVHGPWSVQEIGRELGDPLEAVDVVASLHGAGLVHHCGELVFPTRAAARCFQLADKA